MEGEHGEPQRVAIPEEILGDELVALPDEVGARGDALVAAAMTLGPREDPAKVLALAEQYLDWVITTDTIKVSGPEVAEEQAESAAEHFAARQAERDAERLIPKG